MLSDSHIMNKVKDDKFKEITTTYVGKPFITNQEFLKAKTF